MVGCGQFWLLWLIAVGCVWLRLMLSIMVVCYVPLWLIAFDRGCLRFIMVGCGWWWFVVVHYVWSSFVAIHDDYGYWWLFMVRWNWSRLIMSIIVDVDLFWLVVVCCGWLWFAVIGCGWLWEVVVDCGWLWLFMVDYGWWWVVLWSFVCVVDSVVDCVIYCVVVCVVDYVVGCGCGFGCGWLWSVVVDYGWLWLIMWLVVVVRVVNFGWLCGWPRFIWCLAIFDCGYLWFVLYGWLLIMWLIIIDYVVDRGRWMRYIVVV